MIIIGILTEIWIFKGATGICWSVGVERGIMRKTNGELRIHGPFENRLCSLSGILTEIWIFKGTIYVVLKDLNEYVE